MPTPHFTPPAIILMNPQLGENIGMVARAMLNFGLRDLRLVAPRPNLDEAIARLRAQRAAAGADEVLDTRQEFETLQDAVADLHYIVATSARRRDMVKPTLGIEAAATKICAHEQKSGILFGPERSGLDNDAISHCDVLCHIPLNPHFSSLNLAQAVLLIGYTYFQIKQNNPTPIAEPVLTMPNTRAANRAELLGFFNHLEASLDAAGFLSPPGKRPTMLRNIRNMFHRAILTEQDVRTLRGILSALLRWPHVDAHIEQQMAQLARGQIVTPDTNSISARDLPPHSQNTK